MTTIAASWAPTHGHIAGDRRTTWGHESQLCGDPKVRAIGGWLLLGVCGNSNSMEWLHDLNIDGDAPDDKDTARRILSARNKIRAEADEEGSALAVTPWGICILSAGGTQWAAVPKGPALINTTGSGASYAMGAMLHGGFVVDAIGIASRVDQGTGHGGHSIVMEWATGIVDTREWAE